MRTTGKRSGSIAIFVGALLWSTGGVFIKLVSLDAWGVSFWRSGFAALTLLAVYQWQRRHFTDKSRWFAPYVVGGALCYAMLLVLFVIATKLTTSANAIFLQYTAPIYVLFLEPLISRTRIKRSDLATVAISTGAMALFFIGKFEVRGVWGNIAALVSGVAFATYALLLKHENATERNRWQMVILGHAFIFTAMAMLGVAGVTSLAPTTNDLIMLLYLGVIQIGIAYAFFTFGIMHVRAIDATLISMIEPVLNPVWVFLGVGEVPTTYALIGGAIILALSIVRTVRGASETADVEIARAGE